MAYTETLPNFLFGGHWFSKKRFGIVNMNGQRFPFDSAEKRVVKEPQNEPDSTADPVDWEKLQPRYERLRKKYHTYGYFGLRYEAFMPRSRDGI